jgi:predicted membrane-bound spermidine synthase
VSRRVLGNIRYAWHLARSAKGRRRLLRRLLHRRVVVHERTSPISGPIRVVDRGRERRLEMGGACHSIVMKWGSWQEIESECWGYLHRTPFGLPARPHVLMCGLGGGAALHIMQRQIEPASITVIERDRHVVELARDFFDLRAVGRVHVVNGDARATLPVRRQFDLVIDDATVHQLIRSPAATAVSQAEALASFVAPGGTLVFNAPIDNVECRYGTEAFVAALRDAGYRVAVERIHERWRNWIVYCQPPAARVS